MPKRTLFTNITPLPAQVSREVAVAMLHNHDEMIELNPLVIEHHPIKTPRDAPADEFLDCVWQELTDKIHYLPGGIVKGKVSYKACFRDTSVGVQTHIYAPMGLEIKEVWSIGGSLPGEPPEPRELGLNLPREGLYLREDCDMKCSLVLTGFVRKNLDNSHKVLVERILKKAERVEEHLRNMSPATPGMRISTTGASTFQRGSHMSLSQFIHSPRQDVFSPPLPSPAQSHFSDTSVIHPAFRNDVTPGSSSGEVAGMPPPYQTLSDQSPGYPRDLKQNPYLQQHQYVQKPPSPPASVRREIVVELPGSSPTHIAQQKPERVPARQTASERCHTQNLEVPSFDPRGQKPGSREGKSPSVEVLQLSPVRHHESDDEQYTEVYATTPPKPSFQQFQAQRLGFI